MENLQTESIVHFEHVDRPERHRSLLQGKRFARVGNLLLGDPLRNLEQDRPLPFIALANHERRFVL
ncbi:MAG: hypothetical protein HYX29_00215 [Solirubrobacterales bacterium]|nr:hypothetical protein [Solirubrobacterales bacterium]